MSYYLDDLNSAKNYFEKILQIDSSHAPTLAYLGKLSAEDMNYLRATKYIQEAIKLDPTNYATCKYKVCERRLSIKIPIILIAIRSESI